MTRLFFGKINKDVNTGQLDGGYYKADPQSQWFGYGDERINAGDYCFMIGNGTVSFWKAKEWKEDRLDFDILLSNVFKNTSYLMAFKFLIIDSSLAVLTKRQSPKAFYPVKTIEGFQLEDLLNRDIYDEKNIRQIELKEEDQLEPESINIQLYRKGDELTLYPSSFLDPKLINGFRDRSIDSNGTRKLKDNTYKKLSPTNSPQTFTSSAFSIGSFYDAYCVAYGEKGGDVKRLELNDESIFKVSHGKDTFDDDVNEFLVENQLVIVHGGTSPLGKSSTSQGKWFKDDAQKGDYFYLCRSNSYMILVGQFVSDAEEFEYEWEEEGWLQRRYEIVEEAIDDSSYSGGKKWWTPNNNSTFVEIPRKELALANKKLFKKHFNLEIFERQTDEHKIESTTSNSMTYPKNQILYGPPGTGKTYNTIDEALKIVDPEFYQLNKGNRDNLIKKFNELTIKEWDNPKGKIAFCTFHQSYGYEEFIEGIKPILKDQESDQLSYSIEDGVLKRLSIEASYNIAQHIVSTRKDEVLNFSSMYDNFLSDVEYRLDVEKGEVLLDTRNGGTVVVDSITSKGNIGIKHHNGLRHYTVSKDRLSRLSKAIGDLSEVKNINTHFRSIIGGSNSSAYWAVLSAIRKINPINSIQKNDDKVDYETRKEVVLGLSNDNYKKNPGDSYVIIIDEINRGNVSQVFGELITLIEDNKRLGSKEGLKLTLPYSNEQFGVPSNLYIIGTMNTADRSVEALDTALRRRFSFHEMLPEPRLLETESESKGEIGDIDLVNMLQVINQRIEVLVDRDHTIGHAFFMKAKTWEDLKYVMADKIVPLLQEYFYGDYAKMEMVIGTGWFNTIKAGEVKFAIVEADSNEENIYHLKNISKMKEEEFIGAIKSINYQ